jgi:dolichyl-phosphate-mannose-protein mannosyltransferase
MSGLIRTMARVTSDVRRDESAELPDWPELGAATGPDGSGEGAGPAGAGAALPGAIPYPIRTRLRRGWERGRVWFRPTGTPLPEARGSIRERLVPPFYPEFFRGAGWILPLVVTAIGGLLRFWNLGWPNSIIFDETYYAKDAWSMYVYGWEHTWQGSSVADPGVASAGNGFGHNGAADFSCSPQCAEFVAHPPAGKWVIGAGEQIWGLNPVGWRLMEAVLGTIAIYILARTARRMFRSTLLGCIAGLLISFDGLSFVMARTALLDGIQMFFILCGFSCLVVDRDKVRERFAGWREEHGSALLSMDEFGPRLGWRPWRIAAGVCLGLATATKWNGIVFVAAFALLTVFWDGGTRRACGIRNPQLVFGTILLFLTGPYLVYYVLKYLNADAMPNGIKVPQVGMSLILVLLYLVGAVVAGLVLGTSRLPFGRLWRSVAEPLKAFVSIPVLGVVVFVGSYAGWFINTGNGGGWDRFWANTQPSNFWPTWTDPLRSLWHYVYQQYQFNSTLQTPHPYQSQPWTWFVVGRPVAFYYEAPHVGTDHCTLAMAGSATGTCSAEVLPLGTPLLWWFATAALFFLLWRWVLRRDWRAGAILGGVIAGVAPWLDYGHRTIFSFYAVSFAPFMILGATMAIGAIIGRADAPPVRRTWGAAMAGILVVGIAVMFVYFYPIYTGQTISYNDWISHMWLPSWI